MKRLLLTLSLALVAAVAALTSSAAEPYARVTLGAERTDLYLVVTLGLPYPLNSDRVAVKTEPYPGRWTTHIVVGSPAELDGEFWLWVSQAHAFAMNK